MKILIDPMLACLAADLSTEDKAEILMCIFEYPHRQSDIGLWKYMKQQIDADARKYKEKCDRMAENAKSRWNPKSDMKSDATSQVVVSSNENKNKDNCNVSVSGNAAAVVENSVNNFLISNNFSFQMVAMQNPRFTDYLLCYPPAVIERAERTLKEKCAGQSMALETITKWIQKESGFYKQNNGG